MAQIQDGKLLPPKWSLDDLPITMGTNGKIAVATEPQTKS